MIFAANSAKLGMAAVVPGEHHPLATSLPMPNGRFEELARLFESLQGDLRASRETDPQSFDYRTEILSRMQLVLAEMLAEYIPKTPILPGEPAPDDFLLAF
jgi:hypothetical protein